MSGPRRYTLKVPRSFQWVADDATTSIGSQDPIRFHGIGWYIPIGRSGLLAGTCATGDRSVAGTPVTDTSVASDQKRVSGARARQEASLAAQREARRRETQRTRIIWGSMIAVVAILLAALVYWLAAPASAAPGALQEFPIQGRTHIQRGQAHPDYNSKPPTSGWHYADQVASPGVHVDPIPNEVQVHNLEHGEIMVQYDCPSDCKEMIASLEAIVRSYPKKVLLAPYPGTGHPITLTSWGRLKYLEAVDEAVIRKYIADFKDKGPEVFSDEPMAKP